MKNNIDQFFKDKLENHALPPSEEGWAKVEANLSKKNNVIAWRIAAAIVLAGALITAMIWSQRGTDNKQPVIAAKKTIPNNSIKEKPLPQVSKAEKKVTHPSHKKSLTIPIVPQAVEEHNNLVTKETLPVEEKILPTQEAVAVIEVDKSAFAKATADKQNKKLEATQPVVVASIKQKPIKLEFTLDDLSSEPVATVNETRSSGLKKVWELAREVKNGDGPVREMKNELFALNFRKSKNQ